jgi:hypothetical protein
MLQGPSQLRVNCWLMLLGLYLLLKKVLLAELFELLILLEPGVKSRVLSIRNSDESLLLAFVIVKKILVLIRQAVCESGLVSLNSAHLCYVEEESLVDEVGIPALVLQDESFHGAEVRTDDVFVLCEAHCFAPGNPLLEELFAQEGQRLDRLAAHR